MSHFRSFSRLYSIVLNVTAIMGFAWQSSLHKLSWTDRHCSCHDELRAHEKKCDNLSNKPQHLHYGSLDERGIRLTVIMWSHLSPHLVSQQFVYCSHHMVRAKPVKKKNSHASVVSYYRSRMWALLCIHHIKHVYEEIMSVTTRRLISSCVI